MTTTNKTDLTTALTAKRRKQETLQARTAAYQAETTALEQALGQASANDDHAAVERHEASLAGRAKAYSRDQLTLSALAEQVAGLEKQIADEDAKQRARETNRIIRVEEKQREKLKATIETLVEDATALEATWAQLGGISGSARSASGSLTTAIAIALKHICPEFRQLIVMHPARNSGTGGLDLYGDMFTKRAARATAAPARVEEEGAA